MKRPNRSLEVFSMSALDLFASALGAFIVITMIMFPYFNKKVKAEETLQQKEQELALAKIESVNAQRKATEAMKKAARVNVDPTRVKEENKKLKEAKSKLDKEQTRLAALKKESKRKVPFALLGIQSKSKSFVLAVDLSSSMNQYTSIMSRALERIIEPLGPSNKIGVIGFGGNSGVLDYWPSKGKTLSMTSANKANLRRYAAGLPSKFGGSTPTETALDEALKYNSDAIVLLSDGKPNTLPDHITKKITAANRGKKEIHTVGIGDYVVQPELVKFLNELAKKNKGYFTGLAR